eukprot:GHVH01017106.1.p1 GENE.GHVH01017106.1~~GHVH01017106.1.p1  ORF type:complete len:1165 (-),score=172.92 GHVH01017106.1:567-4061(-)
MIGIFPLLMIWSSLLGSASEQCEVLHVSGLPDFEDCAQAPDVSGVFATYRVELIPSRTKGTQQMVDVQMVIEGSEDQSHSIFLSTKEGGLLRDQAVTVSRDLGLINSVVLRMTSSSLYPWSCYRIILTRAHMQWSFNCKGNLTNSGDQRQVIPEVRLMVAGKKSYHVVVSTGHGNNDGSSLGFDLILGNTQTGRQSEPVQIRQSLQPSSNYSIQFKSRDVGNVNELIIQAQNAVGKHYDPWFCERISVMSDGGVSVSFNVHQWVGSPFLEAVTLKEGLGESLNNQPIMIECHTTPKHFIELTQFNGETLKHIPLLCPAGCSRSEISWVIGGGVHPDSSSICASAIYDGVLSDSGGEVLLSIYDSSLSSYQSPMNNDQIKSLTKLSASSLDLDPSAKVSSYTLSRLLSNDLIDTDVRLIDSFGNLSFAGRLEVRSKRMASWGTVSFSRSDSPPSTEFSGTLVCRELGYLAGFIVPPDEGGCSSGLNGRYLCGYSDQLIIGAAIQCEHGTHESVVDCPMILNDHNVGGMSPSSSRPSHDDDIVIQCTNNHPDRVLPDGSLRLIGNAAGSIAEATKRGTTGRLEVSIGGRWGTVCDDDWTDASSWVACQQMGYDGVFRGLVDSGRSTPSDSIVACKEVQGQNLCADSKTARGVPLTPIFWTEVKCSGSEKSLIRCPMDQKKDILCSHDEDVVLSCTGASGDPSGLGEVDPDTAPSSSLFPLAPPVLVTPCSTSLDEWLPKLPGSDSSGTSYLVECPASCASDQSALVQGTFVYSSHSSLCKSALHNGAITDGGGVALMTITHSPPVYYGLKRNGIDSVGTFISGNGAFTIVPVPLKLENMVIKDPQTPGESLHARSIMAERVQQVIEEAGGIQKWSNVSLLPARSSVTSGYSFIELQEDAPTSWCAPRDSGGNPFPCRNEHVQLATIAIPQVDSFTMMFTVTLADSSPVPAGSVRQLIGSSLCEGFSIEVDVHNTPIFHKLCGVDRVELKYLNAPLMLKALEPVSLAIVYDHSLKMVTSYRAGKKLSSHVFLEGPFQLGHAIQVGHLSGIRDAEVFNGIVDNVQFFPSALSESSVDRFSRDIDKRCSNVMTAAANSIFPKRTKRTSVSNRLCTTECVGPAGEEEDEGVREEGTVEEASATQSHSSAFMDLSCRDSIDSLFGYGGPLS